MKPAYSPPCSNPISPANASQPSSPSRPPAAIPCCPLATAESGPLLLVDWSANRVYMPITSTPPGVPVSRIFTRSPAMPTGLLPCAATMAHSPSFGYATPMVSSCAPRSLKVSFSTRSPSAPVFCSIPVTASKISAPGRTIPASIFSGTLLAPPVAAKPG